MLSAGWDAHRDDPLSKLAVSTDAYARIGELYGKLRLPTLIVQEGGYSLEAVAAASHAFMRRVSEVRTRNLSCRNVASATYPVPTRHQIAAPGPGSRAHRPRLRLPQTDTNPKPSPQRPMRPTDGAGKCAVHNSVELVAEALETAAARSPACLKS